MVPCQSGKRVAAGDYLKKNLERSFLVVRYGTQLFWGLFGKKKNCNVSSFYLLDIDLYFATDSGKVTAAIRLVICEGDHCR